MTEQNAHATFSESQRAALHSLAEMFQDKASRDELRRLVHEGTTLREIIMAYKTNRRAVSTLKTIGSLDRAGGRLCRGPQGAGAVAEIGAALTPPDPAARRDRGGCRRTNQADARKDRSRWANQLGGHLPRPRRL